MSGHENYHRHRKTAFRKEVTTKTYSITCLKLPLKKKTKIGFQDRLMQVKSIAEFSNNSLWWMKNSMDLDKLTSSETYTVSLKGKNLKRIMGTVYGFSIYQLALVNTYRIPRGDNPSYICKHALKVSYMPMDQILIPFVYKHSLCH